MSQERTAYGAIEVDGLAALVADARCVDLRPLDLDRPADVSELIDLRVLPRPRRPHHIEISVATAALASTWE
jgi:hypothetical protein